VYDRRDPSFQENAMAIAQINSNNPIHLQGYGLTNNGSDQFTITGSEPASLNEIPTFYDPGPAGFFMMNNPPPVAPVPVVAETPKPKSKPSTIEPPQE
jgi:hypothetical protein